MSDILSGSELRTAISEGRIILDGDAGSVENVKYDFHMGDRVLKAEIGQPTALSEIPQSQRFVYPGEAVFVLSKERLDLPSDVMALLIPKRKFSHYGVLVLGGLAIDPKYRGFLLLGLYNFSSTPFPLQQGKKIIGALFYRLGGDQVDEEAPTPDEITDFPDELVALIRNYKPIELSGLDAQLSDLRRDLGALKADLDRDQSWRDEFKKSLDAHNVQIDKILNSLQAEADLRKSEDNRLHEKLDSMKKSFFGLGLAKAIGVALLLVLAGALIPFLLERFFSN